MMTEIFIIPGVTNCPKFVNKAVKCATLITMMKAHNMIPGVNNCPNMLIQERNVLLSLSMMTERFIVPINPGVATYPKCVNKAVKGATLIINEESTYHPRGY